jgi:hypothetical protein
MAKYGVIGVMGYSNLNLINMSRPACCDPAIPKASASFHFVNRFSVICIRRSIFVCLIKSASRNGFDEIAVQKEY